MLASKIRWEDIDLSAWPRGWSCHESIYLPSFLASLLHTHSALLLPPFNPFTSILHRLFSLLQLFIEIHKIQGTYRLSDIFQPPTLSISTPNRVITMPITWDSQADAKVFLPISISSHLASHDLHMRGIHSKKTNANQTSSSSASLRVAQ